MSNAENKVGRPKLARYYGHLVEVTCTRRVAGGVACDVRRADTDWPWTVERFTCAESQLVYEAVPS